MHNQHRMKYSSNYYTSTVLARVLADTPRLTEQERDDLARTPLTANKRCDGSLVPTPQWEIVWRSTRSAALYQLGQRDREQVLEIRDSLNEITQMKTQISDGFVRMAMIDHPDITITTWCDGGLSPDACVIGFYEFR